ncbi:MULTISPECIES: sporulation protein YqfD [Cohnella]|uniref:sporulation protein YqfD n=1 Tax=Cohnella TaxID=329857 RepID=UPI0009BA26BD|nr:MULTISPECIES: sporulation protein YqfD [Cohnella]MBN2983310.1 sporulation protein YqfD [Cohnella algarum]
MKGSWIHNLRGNVKIELAGGDAERFLNEATASGLQLWDIAYTKDGRLACRVAVPDFFRLKPLLKSSGCRTRIVQRRGVPFQMARLSRRKTFAVGMAGFVAALFVLSALVWDVQVEGNGTIAEETVLEAARQEGLHPLQWSFRLKDSSELAKRLASRLPDAAWVGVDKVGTKVSITIVESAKPEKKEPESPRDLVASADAVITKIVAENGRPKVKANERVRKGDVLISGILGEGERTKAVVSKGEVRGLVWHEYKIVSPLERQAKTLTGEYRDRSYIVIGNRALQISGYGLPSFDSSVTVGELRRVEIGNWALPLGKLTEREKETGLVAEKLTPEQAKEAGLAQAREQALAAAGRGAVIKAEKLLHEHTDNGKVVLNVLFEIEQSIALERPIIQTPN